MDESKPAPRVTIAIRVRPSSLEQIRKMAEVDGVTVSTMARILLAEAVTTRQMKGRR